MGQIAKVKVANQFLFFHERGRLTFFKKKKNCFKQDCLYDQLCDTIWSVIIIIIIILKHISNYLYFFIFKFLLNGDINLQYHASVYFNNGK